MGIPRHHGHTVKCTGCPPFFLQLVHNPKLLGDQLFAITYMLFVLNDPFVFLIKITEDLSNMLLPSLLTKIV